MAAPTRRGPSLLESFNFAFEGVIHVLRTQRNMRIHFAIAAAVLIAAVAVGVGRIELIALLIVISFVLIAEMINSALEAGIDVATTSFDPLAKLAKDIAAGAVLIATVNAVAVGYLVFSDVFVNRSSRLIERLRDAPAELTVIALVLTIILGTLNYAKIVRPTFSKTFSEAALKSDTQWMKDIARDVLRVVSSGDVPLA